MNPTSEEEAAVAGAIGPELAGMSLEALKRELADIDAALAYKRAHGEFRVGTETTSA